MSVYERDPDTFTPPARSTRSQKRGPLYTFSEAERREYLRKKKDELSETDDRIDQKVEKLKKRLRKVKFEQHQRRRISDMDGNAPPPPPPPPHATELSFVPPPFFGRTNDDAQGWWSYLERFCLYKQFNDAQKLSFTKLLLRDAASDVIESMEPGETDTFAKVKEIFAQRFVSSDLIKWRRTSEIFEQKQGQNEPVDEFITKIRKKAKTIPLTDDVVRYALTKNFRPAIKSKVIGAKTLDELQQLARAAEIAEEQQPTGLDKLNEEMKTHHKQLELEIKKLTDKLSGASIHAIGGDESDDEARGRGRVKSKRVSFDTDSERSRSATPVKYWEKPRYEEPISQHRSQSPGFRREYGAQRGWVDHHRGYRQGADTRSSQWEFPQNSAYSQYQNESPRGFGRGRARGGFGFRGAGPGFRRGRGPIQCWNCGGDHKARFCNAARPQFGAGPEGPQ
jgi:hypothetical protein